MPEDGMVPVNVVFNDDECYTGMMYVIDLVQTLPGEWIKLFRKDAFQEPGRPRIPSKLIRSDRIESIHVLDTEVSPTAPEEATS